MKNIKIYLLTISVILSLIFISCGSDDDNNTSSSSSSSSSITSGTNKIKIASFNIQIFGPTKAGKPEVMDILAKIVTNFDIIAIQEIRDISGNAIADLKVLVNNLTNVYEYIMGPRVGRSSVKEQYAFFYRTNIISVLPNDYTYDDDNNATPTNDLIDTNSIDDFEREPYLVHFKTIEGNFDFVLGNIHTKPDDADIEIAKLSNVFVDASSHFSEQDIIILGDYNADGSYYDEDLYLNDFPATYFNWVIPNQADTTLAASSNTYDRIVTTLSVSEDLTGIWNVYYFDQVFDFGSLSITTTEVSDHYPIWAEFYIDKDTD